MDIPNVDVNISNMETLTEDAQLTDKNKEERPGNCYCGKERNFNIVELLCVSCNRWYHESCIGYQLGKLVPFITNYVFICKNCSPSGLESFRKSQASIPQMCVTAIANMQQSAVKEGRTKILFSKDKEIIPYIEQYWEAMTTMPRRVTQSWYATVHRALVKDIQTIFTYEESSEQGAVFGLVVADLSQIKPNYDAMIKGGALRLTDDGYTQGCGIDMPLSCTYKTFKAEKELQRIICISECSAVKKAF